MTKAERTRVLVKAAVLASQEDESFEREHQACAVLLGAIARLGEWPEFAASIPDIPGLPLEIRGGNTRLATALSDIANGILFGTADDLCMELFAIAAKVQGALVAARAAGLAAREENQHVDA